MISRLVQATADDWKHWACSQRDKCPNSPRERGCMGVPAFIQPRLPPKSVVEPPLLFNEEDCSDCSDDDMRTPAGAWHDHPAARRSFSMESVQMFLAARDSSVECCPEHLDALERHTNQEARHNLEIEKCCKDLRVALVKNREDNVPEAVKESIGALKQLGSRCNSRGVSSTHSLGSQDTSFGEDASQHSDSCPESDSGEAIDRMYEKAQVSKKLGIVRAASHEKRVALRSASPDKRTARAEQSVPEEVQAYQDIMRSKFDRLGQHGVRPLCHTADCRDAVCDAVSRYYEVNKEIGEYYAHPSDRPGGGGLSQYQSIRLGRYASCLADSTGQKKRKPSPAPAPPVQEKPQKLLFGFF